MAMFSGYMQTYSNMKSWVYKWIFWASPVSYSQEVLMLNQLHGVDLECSPSQLIPGVSGASLVNQGKSLLEAYIIDRERIVLIL